MASRSRTTATRGADEDRDVQFERVEYVIDEPDREVAERAARKVAGFAKPHTGPVNEVGPNRGRVFEQHQVRKRRGVVAVQMNDRHTVPGLDDMHPPAASTATKRPRRPAARSIRS